MLCEIKDKLKFYYFNALKEKDFFSTLDVFFAIHLKPRSDEEAIFLAYLFLISRYGFVSLEIKDSYTIYPTPKDLNIDIDGIIDVDDFVKKIVVGSKNLWKKIIYSNDNSHEEYPQKPICKFKNFYYLQKNYVFEKKIIKNLQRLNLQTPESIFCIDSFFKILKDEKTLNVEQKRAVKNAMLHSVSLILGGPGTGKTYVATQMINILSKSLNLLKKQNLKIAITSFTGKATYHLKSKILSDVENIKLDAKTLHLLLNLKKQKPKIFDENKLNYDVIIVDEASMLDLKLTAHLLSLIKNGARVVFIGDPDQLPPIESGNVFAEIANLENIKKIYLKVPKRFETTKIIDFANAIKNKDEKFLDAFFLKNDLFYDIENINKIKKVILDLAYKNFLQLQSIDKDFSKRFIILSSIKKGPFGVDTLNQEIFSLLYNNAKLDDHIYVPIIITKNNYDLGLFNGELGVLKIQKTLDGPVKKQAFFEIEGKIQKFEVFYLYFYEYAYSISIHKSQGSEFKKVAIIIPEGSENFSKELLYTAITRAKNECLIFSTKKILKNLMTFSSLKKSALSFFQK